MFFPPHTEVPAPVFNFSTAAWAFRVGRINFPLENWHAHVPGGDILVKGRFIRRKTLAVGSLSLE